MDKLTENFDISKDLTKAISEKVCNLNGVTIQQMETSIHPMISNVIFARENEILEHERFKTVIALSRVLNDEEMILAIKSLGYQLTMPKK